MLDVFREPTGASPAEVRLAVHLPPGQELRTGQGCSLALSRDGSLLAWVSDGDQLLHVRRLDDYAVRVLEGTEGAATPCFSPDGKSVLTGSHDGTAQVWSVHVKDLLRLAEARCHRELTESERREYHDLLRY